MKWKSSQLLRNVDLLLAVTKFCSNFYHTILSVYTLVKIKKGASYINYTLRMGACMPRSFRAAYR